MANRSFRSAGWIAAGGAIGSLLRYSADVIWLFYVSSDSMISSTLFVNIFGCFIMGFLFIRLLPKPGNSSIKQFLLTGLIGSFTTYSGFGAEVFTLFQKSPVLFAVYLAGSVTSGVTALFIGIWLAKTNSQKFGNRNV